MYRIFFLVLIASTIVQGQSAQQIIDRHFAETGGTDAWNMLSSILIEGSVAMDLNNIVPIKIEHKRPYFKRVSFIIDGKEQLSEGYDGNKAYTFNELDGKYRTLMNYKPDSFETDILNYQKKGFKVDLMGKENINGKDVFKLKITKNTVVEYYFFDTESYQLLREENQFETVNYSDFRKVKGLTFAHRMEATPRGGNEYVIIFDTIHPNAAIPEERFKFD